MVRGGILAVPRGEIEAARACGMSTFTAYRLVILPRAFSIVLPAYSNEVIILLKGTSLASTITLLELMGESQLICLAPPTSRSRSSPSPGSSTTC